jgi:P27 family predicted phage terminase small subunit
MTAEGSGRAAFDASPAAGNGCDELRRVVPAAPGDLQAAGRAVWEVVWTLSRMEPADAVTVERLCRLEDEAARLRAEVKRDGMVLRRVIQNARGERLGEEPRVHPGLAMLRRIGREAAEVAGELGLSPGGRRRLGLDVPEDEREPDALDELRSKYAARRRGLGMDA